MSAKFTVTSQNCAAWHCICSTHSIVTLALPVQYSRIFLQIGLTTVSDRPSWRFAPIWGFLAFCCIQFNNFFRKISDAADGLYINFKTLSPFLKMCKKS